MRDLINNLGVGQSIAPAVQAASINGTGVDLRGADSAMVIVNVGAIAGSGLWTMKLQESDALGSGYADVAAGNLEGAFTDPLVAASETAIGYTGNKRYIRAVGTKTSGTSVAFGAVVLRGHLHSAPALAT